MLLSTPMRTTAGSCAHVANGVAAHAAALPNAASRRRRPIPIVMRALRKPNTPEARRQYHALSVGSPLPRRLLEIGLRGGFILERGHLVGIDAHHEINDVVVDLGEPVSGSGRN